MRLFALFVLLLVLYTELRAQTDTTRNRILDNRLSKEVIKTISKKPGPDAEITIKSEAPFLPYEGKIIRHIIINHIGFERTMYDSARSFRNRITKVANSLHSTTRENIIRNNLFLRENKPLNPYRVADNERYLRDLDFILDSKIIVHRISEDSVDLEIVTRDVFSLGGRVSTSGIDDYRIGLYDANLFGMGQRLQTDIGFMGNRAPFIGFDVLYRKSSLGGSLINATVGYTQLDNARSLGNENEYAYFVRLDRPLVSPYSRLAGGLEVSRNWSRNVYQHPDSLFRKYRYNIEDVWGGYNFSIGNLARNRDRHFIAIRYYRQHYSQQPRQPQEEFNPIYNDQKFVLGEMTFYNQNFYKTRYIYGFGRTEDVPYGKTVSITTGWVKELGMKRMYAGASLVKGFVNRNGSFATLQSGIGTFFTNKKSSDTFFYVNGTMYSKLYEPGKVKIRHLVQAGYARSFNNVTRELLTLNDELTGFAPDSLYGSQRISLRLETTLFTNWKLIGFRFAPFLSLENAILKVVPKTAETHDFFWGTTGGVRIRNENLIFGTIELRAFYFPTAVKGVSEFSFKISTNVRLKYSGRFVNPPSFIQYN
ncbi:MAG TPA: hypothetical protein VIM75_22790 [Ohtaekwangia sp.]|uniref:hypothetical protein n=1 Tax=Ohtaekwangia sp. TaxID=2066019 RepID=UPI002F95037C